MSVQRLADAQEAAARLAKEAFESHRVRFLAPGEFLCMKPGTGIYSFTVILRPGTVIVYGDIGEWVLRHSDRDSIGWLRGAVSSPDYLLEKVKAGERESFYVGDALDVVRERALEDEMWRSAFFELQDIDPDELTQPTFAEIVNTETGDCEVGLLGWAPSVRALWLVEALRLFVRLVDAPDSADAAPGPATVKQEDANG